MAPVRAGRPARLPITDVHRNRAGASVVGGKLESGALRPGSRVAAQPGGEVLTVKSVEVDGQVRRTGGLHLLSARPTHKPSWAASTRPFKPHTCMLRRRCRR